MEGVGERSSTYGLPVSANGKKRRANDSEAKKKQTYSKLAANVENLVSSGRKICYYARKQKFCNIASLKKQDEEKRKTISVIRY